ncbi:MAG TPA: flagellar motor switch protein FliM [Parvibaculum sp.]|uniref:flagellar motor switch protein FliM n=1 Tax=Parvibaculum sp. TaxID=2024848 RepID=UPI002C4ED047|nr:flagellar motor switch protein FliM [Parvibaculum sp.]HMM13719.1 flagellar motor switch protein FliM [Parvibaculum sp.]
MADADDIDQDEMAAAMEAMDAMESEQEQAVPSFRTAPERVLNQDEIDSLLGFEMDNDANVERTGIRAIINSALVSYERLPMLEIVFDRLVRLMTTSLRNFTSDNVEVSLDNISSIRFGDYLNSIPLPAILAVFRAREWDNYGMFTVDSNLIYSIVDVLLGGRRGTAAMRIEGRPYTTIELNLVQRMIEVVLQDAKAAFEPLSPITFELDRMETNPRFAAIARPANAAILVKLRIDMEDRGGRIEMLLPYATLEPIRELLLQMFMGEKFGRDSIWESHLATELWSTEIPIEAVLDEQKMSLREVMDFKVGQTLMLNNGPDALVEMRCGGVSLASGRIGRMGNNVAVRIENGIKKPNRVDAVRAAITNAAPGGAETAGVRK